MMLNKYVFIFLLAIPGQSYPQEVRDDILHAIEEGAKIINAVEKFHAVNNSYPETIIELSPSYIDKIPEPGLREGDSYYYSTVPKERESDIVYGYKLSFFIPKRGLFVALRTLGAREAKMYVFQPSMQYESNQYATTIHTINGWAYQISHRVYTRD